MCGDTKNIFKMFGDPVPRECESKQALALDSRVVLETSYTHEKTQGTRATRRTLP